MPQQHPVAGTLRKCGSLTGKHYSSYNNPRPGQRIRLIYFNGLHSSYIFLDGLFFQFEYIAMLGGKHIATWPRFIATI